MAIDVRRRVPSIDALLRTEAGRRAAAALGRPLLKRTLVITLEEVRAAAERGTAPPGEDDILARASHVASCDATLSRLAPSLSGAGDDAPWMVGPIIGLALPRPSAVTPTQGRTSRTDAGVRLFLLHASFLI